MHSSRSIEFGVDYIHVHIRSNDPFFVVNKKQNQIEFDYNTNLYERLWWYRHTHSHRAWSIVLNVCSLHAKLPMDVPRLINIRYFCVKFKYSILVLF